MKLVFDDQAILAGLPGIVPRLRGLWQTACLAALNCLSRFPWLAMSVAIPTRSNGWYRGCHMLWCTKSIGSRRELS